MNWKENWKTILIRGLSYVLTVAVTATITYTWTQRKNWRDMSKLQRLEEVIDTYFIEDYNIGRIEDAAAAAMVDALGNPWSYYISASEYEAYMNNHTNSYVGVGITITYLEDGSGIEIQRVEENGGAAKAGLLPGDIITAVDGNAVANVGINEASDMITGEENTTVTLTIQRGEETFDAVVERMYIQVIVATGKLLEGDIGLVTIKNFNERSASETLRIIEDLMDQGAKKLIFDVRYNPGGYKDEMVKVLDYLLPEGQLFRSVDYQGAEEIDRSDSKCLEVPMVVLINEDSYSAAEFFAAALQEYEWATVVGTPSTGKSHFQICINLGDGSAVNLSVGKYYTPNGVSLADVGGLQPDRIVEVDEETYMDIYYGQIPAEEDPQIAAAVEVVKSGE